MSQKEREVFEAELERIKRKAALSDQLAQALRQVIGLVSIPDNEYVLRRKDGEWCGIADEITVGNKYEEAKAALAAYEAAKGE
jgi:hypothetical protein